MNYDVVIIGAGPAGMTAAVYARRANKTVLLLEAASFGGQIVNAHSIENYPTAPHISGFDFAMRLYEQATALGAEFVFEKAVSIEDKGEYKQVNTPSASYHAGTVIIATGLVTVLSSAVRQLLWQAEQESHLRTHFISLMLLRKYTLCIS